MNRFNDCEGEMKMGIDRGAKNIVRPPIGGGYLYRRYSRECGAILVVSLIMLLLVTVLGLSTIGTTTMQEKMAANTRDKDLAFQAAELALKVAEKALEEEELTALDFTPECGNGLCSPHATSANVMRWEDPDICGSGEDIWSCDKSRTVGGADAVDLSNHSQAPQYFIEILADLDTGDHLNIGNIGDSVHSEEATVYRITAIGYGGSTTSQAVLQSTYAK